MKKFRKLTPATLKRIIAEEKSKILKEQKITTNINTDRLEKYVKLLRVLREVKSKKNSEVKKINKLTEALKQKLLSEL